MNEPLPTRQTARALLQRIAANPVEGRPSEMRAAFARLAGPQPALKQLDVGGVHCVIAGSGAPAAIWLHGGGYVFGGAESHGNTVLHLAERLGGPVLMPLYARAPSRTWPAQRDDALAVLDRMPRSMPVIGDSAGGHLALHVAFARPGRVSDLVLISPNTDRTGRNTTRAENSARDPMNDDAQDTHLASLAIPGAAPDSVDASPRLGPLHRLPRTYITYAENEVLAGDGALLAEAASKAGVAVTRHVEQELMHMWTLWPQALPAAGRTLNRIADWIHDGA
jgi:acetyl esterase/lipase